MPYVVFEDTYLTNYITATNRIRVTYTETVSSNQIKVSVTNVEISSTASAGAAGFWGKILVNGTELYDFTGQPTYTAKVTGDVDSYNAVANVSSAKKNNGYVLVANDTASIPIVLTGGYNLHPNTVFGIHAYVNSQDFVFGIRTTESAASKTITLTRSTLTVKPNGGTWGSPASSSNQTFQQAPSTTKPIADPTPPTGKDFTSWSLSGGGSFSSGTYTFGSSNGTLTAGYAWKTYTINYNKGANGVGTNTSATKTYGVDLTLLGATFTRTGYTQDGWSTTDGGSKTYDLGGTYTANSGKTLYPHWKINTWTVKYNANGGSSTPANQTKTYGVTLTLASAISRTSDTTTITTTYNYNGSGKANTTASSTKTVSYTFKEWNTVKAGTGTAYAAEGNYTANAAATMYAQWTTNAATYSAVTLPTPTWTGRTFQGWYDASSGGNKIGNAGATYRPQANITLYAHWTINTYSFTATAGDDIASVKLNGTSNASSVTKTVEYGSSNTFEATLPTNPAYTYTFDGWYKGSSKQSSLTTYTVTASAALSLTAKANKTVNSYTLSFTKMNTGGTAAVRRTSSPYKGASTGSLSNGATIYYGDVLEISYTIDGGYELDQFTINGVSYDQSPQTITVGVDYPGNITVVITLKNAGVVWIWNGTAWVKYIPYIWNGSAWVKYIPYIWNGSAWVIY